MSHLYYRLSNTTDPEDRLEDAALYKALYDVVGDGLTLVPAGKPIPQDGLFIGRSQKNDFEIPNLMAQPQLEYWKDPAFLAGISRSFKVTDYAGAKDEVARLHGLGKDAFLKSTKQKHFIKRINHDQSFLKEMDGMAYSFIDLPECLMVQEALEMHYEHRFIVIDGQVVTHSPIAIHLTPMSRGHIQETLGTGIENSHFKTPESRDGIQAPEVTKRLLKKAQSIADLSNEKHLCIDLAILGVDLNTGPIEIVEFNPMQPGQVGLYACDPNKIAVALYKSLDPDMQSDIKARRQGLLFNSYIDPTKTVAFDQVKFEDEFFEDEDIPSDSATEKDTPSP